MNQKQYFFQRKSIRAKKVDLRGQDMPKCRYVYIDNTYN